MDQGIPELKEEQERQRLWPHTRRYTKTTTDRNNENKTNGLYNRQDVERQSSDAYTHTPRNARWRPYRSTRAFRGAESTSRKPAQSKIHKGREELGLSPTTLRPRQKVIPFSIPLSLFYSPRREAVTTCYIIFIRVCPFGQRYASILYLKNVCDLGYSHQPTCT